MNIHAWHNSGRHFLYKGHRIFYRSGGSGGETILFIHGFPTAGWDWHLLWPWLSEEYQLIAPDLLGFGFSDKPLPYDYSIAEQADLIEALLLQQFGTEECHVLAHDYGDTVAQELLARQQEGRPGLRLRSVCFLNGGLFPKQHFPLPIQRLLVSPLGPWLSPLLGRWSLEISFRQIFGPYTKPSGEMLDQFWDLIRYDDGKQAIPYLIRYMEERKEKEARWVGALTGTEDVPKRLIDGVADPIAGRPLAGYYRQVVPDADVIELEDIGHYPQIEAPEAVLQHYLYFLSRLSG